MNLNYLDFEQPIAELEEKIAELRRLSSTSNVEIHDEITRLEKKSQILSEQIYSKLSDWDVVKVARHPNRPQGMDYIENSFSDFVELHGDRHFRDDRSIIGGLAKLGEQSVMIIAQQKGRSTNEKILHNFGMPKPEGYRKALRLMQLAERFGVPIITMIDTPGAYPGIDAEQRNQSEAIATNLFEASYIKVPIICTVIGEGGSGGALAIGVGDRVIMMQYSIYSVISPEGCASILWKSAEKASTAAAALALTTSKLKEQGIIDHIIEEPLGGAHRDPPKAAKRFTQTLQEELAKLLQLSTPDLLQKRYDKLMAIGDFQIN